MSQPTFEEAMKALETVVNELESGELTLDQSLAKYEAGVKMYRTCHKLLEGAEQKVQLLLKDDEQGFQTTDAALAGDEPQAESSAPR